ncbi:MAG TPA: HD domain-containing phosphohydrolase [Candidatus Eisenbacteria bacterium]|nr:HD domain-containing phosphohydrolase [Candidatus Eisenbacteria bacterium]
MATKTRALKQGSVAAPAPSGLPSAHALLTGLNDVARSLVPLQATDSSLHQVAEGARRLLTADGIAILSRSHPGECVFRYADGALAEWNGFSLSGESSELLEALFLVDNVNVFHRKQRSPWTREFLFTDDMEWGAIAPIRAHGENLGALLINHGSPLRFRTEHAAGLQTLATLAGVAILEDRYRAHLEDLFMSVIVSLTMALEAKDPYTEGHSVRVAAYSEAIGKQLGLPARTLDMIHRSCLVHDIGKIAVDETILRKGSQLSTGEREKMDMHPLIGESILRPIALLHPLLPGVRSHHEHFDGSGYPDGLTGETIPIEARVMAVADAFDAMTSNRPYRPAMPEDEARQELRRHAGTHFDPRVVAAFEEIYPAVKRTLEHMRPRTAEVDVPK